jgi:hypothetical protein
MNLQEKFKKYLYLHLAFLKVLSFEIASHDLAQIAEKNKTIIAEGIVDTSVFEYDGRISIGTEDIELSLYTCLSKLEGKSVRIFLEVQE